MDGRFWMKTQTGHWRGEVRSAARNILPLQTLLSTWRYTCVPIGCWTGKGPNLDLEVKLRSGQSSSWKFAGRFWQNLRLKPWVLILAAVLTHKLHSDNSLHPPQQNGAHTLLFCRIVPNFWNVWYRVGVCIDYGHHFMTHNNSRWNLYIRI